MIIEAVGDRYTQFEGYKEDGGETRIGLSYAKLCSSVQPGNRILLADGSISIEVVDILSGTELQGRVLNTKELGQRKNCNLPGVKVDLPVLTDKDIDDLKNFVDIRPIRHWLQVRVRAHVFICVLALLLKRIFEIHYLRGKCTMEPLEEISKSKLIKYKVKFSKREDRSQTFPKVTNTTPIQKKYFNMIGIRNPMSLEKFIW